LIEKGLDAALLSHSDTSDPPESVFAKISDQHRAIRGLYDFISGARELGISYIRELHSVLTEHQDTYTGRDTLGNSVTRELPKGVWKKLKNNVEHPDGTIFEYCPPEHVDQEMDNLLALHRKHMEQKIPPDIEAAWLHHRFSLIHPFTDGNGRVARCLATLVLLKAQWLPLVITRRDRELYISALRAADDGDLRPLVDLFGGLQRKAIREALSLSEQVIHDATAIQGVLAAVRTKFAKRREDHTVLIQRAFKTADSLQLLTRQRLQEVASEVNAAIASEGPQFTAYMYQGERGGDRAKFNYHQIIECAKALKYYANLPVYQSWAALTIRTEIRTEVLFSFHGIGHEATGVLGCSAMLYTKERTEDDDTVVSNFTTLSDEPFEFTYVEDAADVQQRFRHWLDEKVLKGLEHWQNVV
jgi:Fic family protein